MLIATGLSRDDLNKPQVGIGSVWYEGNPCNMHLADLGNHVKQGVEAAGLRRDAVQHRRRLRRHLDGHRRHELLAPVARPHRRLDRDDHGRPVVRRPGRPARLRQEHARHASWPWAGSTARRSWSTAARSAPAARRSAARRKLDVVSAFQAYGQKLAGAITEDERKEILAQELPRPGRVRRDVHRQHDVLVHRVHGPVAALLVVRAGGHRRRRSTSASRGRRDAASCSSWTSSRATSSPARASSTRCG